MVTRGIVVDKKTPIEQLISLAEEGASGEIVVAGEALEVHVFLVDGKVAWATSSNAPNALTRNLIEMCGLDSQAIKEVVEECRRTRRPFGETLVEWGVATLDQVREALRRQVAGSVSTLYEAARAESVFLPRKVAYKAELTFPLDDVLEHGEAPGPAQAPVDARVATLLKTLPDAQWARQHQPNIEAPQPEGDLERLAAVLDANSAASMTLRSTLGAVLGASVAREPAWLFCGLPPATSLGMAQVLLAHAAGAAVDDEATPAPKKIGEVVRREAVEVVSSLDPVEAAMARSEQLQAVLVLDTESDSCASVYREGLDIEGIAALAKTVYGQVPDSLSNLLSSPNDDIGSVIDEHITLSVSQEGLWHFATEPREGPGKVVWLVVDRSASQGFGWALLTSIARQISDALR